MSARKLHKRPKYMSARKLHERPKLHERKNITKTTRVQTNLHVIQEFIKNRYLIRARTSNRRMHYLTKKSTLWQCPVRWPIIQKDSLFCTSALTVRLGLTWLAGATWLDGRRRDWRAVTWRVNWTGRADLTAIVYCDGRSFTRLLTVNWNSFHNELPNTLHTQVNHQSQSVTLPPIHNTAKNDT